jgi:hypothetical protein
MGRRIGSNAHYPRRQENNMTYSIGQAVFFDAGRICRSLSCLALLALAGCAGASSQNAAPATPGGPGIVGPQDTGTYPNLNVLPQQAAPQFTDADKNAKLAALNADRAAVQTGGGARPNPREAAELNKLARNHGKDTLKEIGATCDPALDPNCK